MHKQTLLPRQDVGSLDDFKLWAIGALEKSATTKRQFSALAILAARHLPCNVELLQRSAKSILYLRIDGRLEYRIGQRAELYGAIPRVL